MTSNPGAPAPDPVEPIVASMLRALDPEPGREGLRDTPRRVARAFRHYTSGYSQDPKKVIGDALFAAETDEMVVVKDIEIYSLCEHHLAPFFGKAHVAYIPSGKIVGLSKIARVVDIYARRLQVQERLTMQVANALNEVMQPRGVIRTMMGCHSAYRTTAMTQM